LPPMHRCQRRMSVCRTTTKAAPRPTKSCRPEMLEKQISDAADDRSSSVSDLAPRRESIRKSTPVPSPEASLTVADGQESWVMKPIPKEFVFAELGLE
jgi:hypothetical protein